MYICILMFSVIFIFFLLYILKLNLKTHVFLWGAIAVLILIFYVVPFFLAVTGNIELITLEGKTINNSSLKYVTLLYVNLFLFCVIVGYSILYNSIKKGEPKECTYDISSVVDILAIIGFFLIFYSIGSPFQALKINRVVFLNNPIASLRTIGTYLSYGVFASVYIMVRKKRIRHLTVVSCILFLFVYLFVFRDRVQPVGLILAALVGYLARDNKQKIGVGTIVALMLLAFFGVSWQVVRWYLPQVASLRDLISLMITGITQGFYVSLSRGELGYLYKANQFAFYLVPKQYDYFYGATLLRMLLLPFPSSVVCFKPAETQIVFSKMLGVAIPGASRPTTIIGDIYMNFGILGVIVGTNLGLIFAVIQLLFNKFSSCPIGIVIGAYFPFFLLIFLRGSLNGLPVLICWAFIIWVLKIVYSSFCFKGL